MSTTEQSQAPAEAAVDEFAEKVFGAVLGAMECQAMFMGDRLGWYDTMARSGAMTSVELSAATATDERYAREWLEHQTVSGYLAVDDAAAAATERRYSLPAAHAEVLANRDSLAFMLPFARFAVGLGKQADAMLEAFRTGGGVPWSAHGADARDAQGDANRPMFLRLLGHEYLSSIPEIDAALKAGGRVADVGCGYGWSAIGVAEAFPSATVDGFDVDVPSIEIARRNAAQRGVADRVSFHTVDAASAQPGGYDLVLALECIHDLGDPVSVLSAMRSMASPDGTVVVMDERVGEAFTGEDDPVERIMYGFSLTCCLADGRAHGPSVATGTVMRPATLERYAVDAGFSGVEILPIDNDFFRFYRLAR